MKYKLNQRANPQDRTKSKWYAAPVFDGNVSKSALTAEIVNLSSLSRGDVSNVIECIIDVVPKYLLMGKSVSLGDLGTLRLSFTSEGVDKPGEFTVTKIRGKRVVFLPSTYLRTAIEKIQLEKE